MIGLKNTKFVLNVDENIGINCMLVEVVMVNDFDVMMLHNVCYIERETIALADWLIDNRCTVRQLSKEFDIPRSTVHKRLQCDLRDIDYDKWKQCKAILEYNDSEAVNRMAKANRERRMR